MNKIVTLLEFLESTGAKVRLHDIGRRITKISREDFLKFEKQEITYPYPLQQQAWFAVNVQDESLGDEPVIWFLRFPLDETGKLLQAGRDYFIHRLFEAATAVKSEETTELAPDALKDNPHVFKPREDKMAIYHARIARQLKQPVSRYYQHAREYLSGEQGWEQWNFVGFQGIADFIEHLDKDNNQAMLCNALPHLPAQPLEAICHCLENHPVSLAVSQALLARCEQELQSQHTDASRLGNLCRAISQSVSTNSRHQLIEMVLNSSHGNSQEIVSAISARCWEWLAKPENTALYLNQLSRTPQEVFNQCLSDLLFMPGLRNTLLEVIRDPQRPQELGIRFGNMMQNLS
ncbi:MAG: DUF3549 family protein [Gammaproteobacteria bacterium]|nr:DUF3549 family protein [Gammaproteobacteria bacterium]